MAACSFRGKLWSTTDYRDNEEEEEVGDEEERETKGSRGNNDRVRGLSTRSGIGSQQSMNSSCAFAYQALASNFFSFLLIFPSFIGKASSASFRMGELTQRWFCCKGTHITTSTTVSTLRCL